MAEKLWKGRFELPTDKLVEEYTASIHFDSRLYRYDIEGSIAHCRMLAECGIISHEEASRIVQTLGEIVRDIERGRGCPGFLPGGHPHGDRKRTYRADRRDRRQTPHGQEPK